MKKQTIVIITVSVLVVLLIGGVVGGYYLYLNKSSEGESSKSESSEDVLETENGIKYANPEKTEVIDRETTEQVEVESEGALPAGVTSAPTWPAD